MQLSPAKFNGHIARMGTSMFHRRAYSCPCMGTSGSNAADASCPNCDGKGVTWAAETGPHKVGFTSQTAKRGEDRNGSWEPGDAVLTIGSDTPVYQAGANDRFRAAMAQSPFSFVLRKGLKDKLHGTIVSLDRVFYRAQDKTLVECAIPTVGAEGLLTWSGAQVRPPEGAFYSVSGVRYDEFYAYMTLTQDRVMHDARLPRKLPIRRFDAFGR